MSSGTPEQQAAYAKLDEAIAEVVDAYRPDDGRTDVVCDAVVLVGLQNVDEDGDRVGSVSIYPRHGSQPVYVTSGLIERARVMLAE